MSLRGLEAWVRVVPCFVAFSWAGGCGAPEEAKFTPGMDPQETETPSFESLGPAPPLDLACARIDGEVRLTWKNPQRYESIQPKPPSAADVRALEAAYVLKYGVEVSEPIDGGFLFIDGGYVEPPFRVARKGLVVYVNDLPVSARPPFTFTEPTNEEKEPPALPRPTGSPRSSRETGRRASTSIVTGSTS